MASQPVPISAKRRVSRTGGDLPPQSPLPGASPTYGGTLFGSSPPKGGPHSLGRAGGNGCILLGSSPPSAPHSLGRSGNGGSIDRASTAYAGAKKYWKRLLYDEALDGGKDYTVGFVTSMQQQERRSGAGAWSLRVHDSLLELPFAAFVAKFPEEVPFHRIAYFRHHGQNTWESELYKKRAEGGGPADSPAAAVPRRPSLPSVKFEAAEPAAAVAAAAAAAVAAAAAAAAAGTRGGPAVADSIHGDSDVSADSDEDEGSTVPRPDSSDGTQEEGDVDAGGSGRAEGASSAAAASAAAEGQAGGQDVELSLPEACWMNVLHKLAVRDVCRMGRVNRWLRQLSACPTVWQAQHRSLFGVAPEAELNGVTVRKKCRRSALRAARWLEGDVQRVSQGAVGTVCLQLDEFKVVSADGVFVRVTHTTGERIATLPGHTGRVTGVAFDEEHVVSGCSQGVVKLWGMDDLKCARTMRGHEAAIAGVAVLNGIPISASEDGVIKLWDITGAAILTLESPRLVHAIEVQLTTGVPRRLPGHCGLGRAHLGRLHRAAAPHAGWPARRRRRHAGGRPARRRGACLALHQHRL